MTAEPALKLVETTPVEEKALTIVDQAKAVKVTDAQTYTAAGELWKQIVAMMKEIEETFDPIIDANHKAWKMSLAKKAKYYDPLKDVKVSVKKLMSDYDAEQDRIRKAEEARLAEIARKQAEEQALLDAIAAEEEAKRNGATREEAAQEAQAIINEPVYVAPVVLPKATPKLQGGPVYRTVWKARIVNERLIPREYLTVDMVKINGVVRSLKGATNIPGVMPYEERV